MNQRGLVELARPQPRAQIDEWGGGGGGEVQGGAPCLVFDDGLGGFLPLSAADVSCEPLSLAATGIVPVPSTLMVQAEGVCVVKATRRALYRHWQLADGEEASVRGALARAARLVAEITLGRGEVSHLAALDAMAMELATQGLAAAWPLGSSLRHFREQWERHARRESCPEGVCLERRAAPCQAACPANIDIPTFMAHLGNGDHRATVEVIRQDNPLPQTCGYVCPAPCESACVRGSHDGAVFIRPMKSRAAEQCLAEGGYPKPAIAPDTGRRIGMVGSGPSSLTAAYTLRTLGHDVEIHEAQEHAGGMLRYGIPAYRNPPDAFEREVDQIRALGVRIFTNSPVASVEEFRKGYDAVFLGLGTQKARLLPVEGAHLPFVLGGIDFLRAARSGGSVRVGPRVVVIGGGNVAIDVALTALRQGARRVDLTSLEKRREMPASPGEIELAVAEGVQLHPGWGPLRFEEEGLAVFQFCERVKDETGRFDPKFDGNRLLSLEADHVILATGQGTDLACLEGSGVENNRGFIVADPKTKMTKVPGVFAGGDGQHGPRTAVEAIRSGKIAAASIDAFLRGAPVDAGTGMPVRRAEVTPLSVLADVRSPCDRAMMPERTAEETAGEGNYVKIEEGLTDAMAHDEARRCLRCDVCIGCGLCMAACSEMGVEALRMADTPAGRLAHFDYLRPAERCIGCGACTQVCPTGAIHLEDRDGVRRTVITGTVVKEEPLLACAGAVRRRRRPRTGTSFASAFRTTWRLRSIASSARPARACGLIVPRWGERPCGVRKRAVDSRRGGHWPDPSLCRHLHGQRQSGDLPPRARPLLGAIRFRADPRRGDAEPVVPRPPPERALPLRRERASDVRGQADGRGERVRRRPRNGSPHVPQPAGLGRDRSLLGRRRRRGEERPRRQLHERDGRRPAALPGRPPPARVVHPARVGVRSRPSAPGGAPRAYGRPRCRLALRPLDRPGSGPGGGRPV
ncbi:MAG: FAD-dependent oxidoreductase [Holophagales bacterium]|nr:FAD-dependent oxidoreductase [Holophagales bacterium]